MVAVVSLQRQQYGGKWREVGEEFDVEERFVKMLTVWGRIRQMDTMTRHLDATPRNDPVPEKKRRGRPRKQSYEIKA